MWSALSPPWTEWNLLGCFDAWWKLLSKTLNHAKKNPPCSTQKLLALDQKWELFWSLCIVRYTAGTKRERQLLKSSGLACQQPCQWEWKCTVLFTYIRTNTTTGVHAAALGTGWPNKKGLQLMPPTWGGTSVFCLGNTYLSFEKAHYRQVRDTPMGACLSDHCESDDAAAGKARLPSLFSTTPSIMVYYVDYFFWVIKLGCFRSFITQLNYKDLIEVAG